MFYSYISPILSNNKNALQLGGKNAKIGITQRWFCEYGFEHAELCGFRKIYANEVLIHYVQLLFDI